MNTQTQLYPFRLEEAKLNKGNVTTRDGRPAKYAFSHHGKVHAFSVPRADRAYDCETALVCETGVDKMGVEYLDLFMTTPETTQPQTVMPLEEVNLRLSNMLGWGENSLDEQRALRAALHHLEAQRKECECMEFHEAQQPYTDNEGYEALLRVWDSEWRIGSLSLNPIAFCPWCGKKVPSPK